MASGILALIPARSGSKGLPGKNIKDLLGKPLLAWSVEQARACKYIDKVVVSTDDSEIAQIAQSYGAEIPFLRPAEMAKDDSPVLDTVLHILDEYARLGTQFDVVALLEPTSPLRADADLDRALSAFTAQLDKYDAVVSLGEIHESPYYAKVVDQSEFVAPLLEGSNYSRRQQLPKTYFPYGVIYATKVTTLRESRTFYPRRTMPYFIERWQNFEVDDLVDFVCIEAIMRERRASAARNRQ